MTIRYLPFEIEITEKDVQVSLVRAEVLGATRLEEIPASPPTLNSHEIQQAQHWLERGFINRDYSRDFGRRLFDTIFTGQIRELLREATQYAGPNSGLRLILKLPVPKALTNLPWELMYDEDGGRGFLARTGDTPLVRHFAGLPLPNRMPTEGPLRVLVVIASPSEFPKVSGEQEAKSIIHALSKPRMGLFDIFKTTIQHLQQIRSLRGLIHRLHQHRMVEVEVLEHATRQSLQSRMLEAKNAGYGFHIIHFIGHTDTMPKGSALVLEDADGRAAFIPAEEFAELIDFPTINLLVLNACETASTHNLMNSVALATLRRRIPAVIGMQTPVFDRTALEFASALYEAWAAGEPIEAALAYARRLIWEKKSAAAADWSIPVLYMGPTEGLTLNLKPPEIRLPTPVKIARWSIALLLSLLGTLALLLQVPDIDRTVRTQVPVIRCLVPYPMRSQPSFNIAIAEFGVSENDGPVYSGIEGRALSNYLSRAMQAQFTTLGLDLPYEIRPAEHTCKINGDTPAERLANAEELSHKIGAQLVIYGVIQKRDSRSYFNPEFYVSPENLNLAQEIIGGHKLGLPMLLPQPLVADELDIFTSTGLTARNQALILITIGLAHYSNDNYERAREVFKQAESLPGWMFNAGKEVLFLLEGSATGRLLARKVLTLSTEEYNSLVDESINYFNLALEINPNYLRAQIGRAAMLTIKALGDPNENPPTLNPDLLAQSEEAYLRIQDNARAVLNDPLESEVVEKANIFSKVQFGLGKVHMLFGEALQGVLAADGIEMNLEQAEVEYQKAEEQFIIVVRDSKDKDALAQDLAGLAYAHLGQIAIFREDYENAVTNFLEAIKYVSPFYKGQFSSFLGYAYLKLERTDEALDALEDAVDYAGAAGDERTVREAEKILRQLRQ